jgi:tRNA pseudouridine55 synthase
MRNELSGFLVIDKPAAMSSAQVVFQVKKLLGARKVGHTGTLDPFATGVLICCINQATRLARFFLEGSKTYDAVLRLGVDTDTQDATGKVIGEGRVPPPFSTPPGAGVQTV